MFFKCAEFFTSVGKVDDDKWRMYIFVACERLILAHQDYPHTLERHFLVDFHRLLVDVSAQARVRCALPGSSSVSFELFATKVNENLYLCYCSREIIYSRLEKGISNIICEQCHCLLSITCWDLSQKILSQIKETEVDIVKVLRSRQNIAQLPETKKQKNTASPQPHLVGIVWKLFMMHWYQEEDEEEDLMFSPALLARRASESWIETAPIEVSVRVNFKPN